MRTFWQALQQYRAQGHTNLRMLSGEHRRAIERLQGTRPAKHCTFCAQPCPGRRRSWCSQGCINNYWIACNEPGIVEQVVYTRDKGVCSLCGLDTDQLKDDTYSACCEDFSRAARRLHGFTPSKHHFDVYNVRQASDLLMWLNNNRLWDIDHIVAVHKGGGCGYKPGVENLRTLCRPCHRFVSAKQTRERNLLRKSQSNET